jgi:uncharacterized membrane protein
VEKVESSLSTASYRDTFGAAGALNLTASTIMSWSAVPFAAILALFARPEQNVVKQTIATSSAGVVVVLLGRPGAASADGTRGYG